MFIPGEIFHHISSWGRVVCCGEKHLAKKESRDKTIILLKTTVIHEKKKNSVTPKNNLVHKVVKVYVITYTLVNLN